MSRSKRVPLSPGWLVLHLVAIALIAGMVRLGIWQLTVSNHKHFHLQNFGYALQWWAFSLFVVFMWVRMVRDAAQRTAAAALAGSQDAEPAAPAEADVAYRRYAMPQSAVSPPSATDALYAEYNDYLAELARKRADGTDAERTTR